MTTPPRAAAAGSAAHHSADKTPPVWTEDRIRALGAITDLPTAASIFGLSRTAAYDLARQDDFPVPVIRVGARYRVAVAAILAVLHLAPDPPPNQPPP
ncbi:MAG TPA: DNA-binding protein [Micromonosporaceae bacterium]|nr:DNA-binding protein [Micromonosporaceae bacterium]